MARKRVKKEIEEPDYTFVTAGIHFEAAEILGKSIETTEEAIAFQNLANKFFGSEYVFEQLKVFVGQHWETALSEIIAPSSNG